MAACLFKYLLLTHHQETAKQTFKVSLVILWVQRNRQSRNHPRSLSSHNFVDLLTCGLTFLVLEYHMLWQ
jgi:hypothetical protein